MSVVYLSYRQKEGILTGVLFSLRLKMGDLVDRLKIKGRVPTWDVGQGRYDTCRGRACVFISFPLKIRGTEGSYELTLLKVNGLKPAPLIKCIFRSFHISRADPIVPFLIVIRLTTAYKNFARHFIAPSFPPDLEFCLELFHPDLSHPNSHKI